MARDEVLIPEVIDPDDKLPQDLVALRRFSVLMDEAIRIPGTRRAIGLDAIVGLIPGVGDIIGALLSAWIIAGALRHRVPVRKILRMIVNVLIDLVFGAVPVAGDVFDFMYEENVMNMRLLLQHRDRSRPPRSTSEIAAALTLIVILIIGFSLVLTATVIAVVVWLAGQRLN